MILFMTTEDFYAQVKRLGLRRSNVPGVWMTSKGEPYSVEADAARLTPEARAEFIQKLKSAMGIFPEED
jgi:hypothetical protein